MIKPVGYNAVHSRHVATDRAMTRKRSPKSRPEHDSNMQPSKREKHEKGDRRRRMGEGKDKKRKRPEWFQR
jgi:hypothetical protein